MTTQPGPRVLGLPLAHHPEPDAVTMDDDRLLRSVKRALAGGTSTGAGTPVNGADGDFPSIAGFRVIAELGRGGMGVVYAAEQAHPRRRVAVKVIRDGRRAHPDQIARFHREVDALGALHHPAIATVFQAGLTEDGDPYFTMELVEGRTLMDAVEGMPLRDRLELFARICDAAQYAHERAVIHRDLKPGNILVVREGASGQDALALPKIVDFGVARLGEPFADQTVTQPGQVHGTPRYMSPEQIRGDGAADARSDVYALGAILYELATGTPALNLADSSWHSTVRAVCEARFPRPSAVAPGIPPALERVILTAMSARQADRYQSAADLAADVRSRLLGQRAPRRRLRDRLHPARRRAVRLGLPLLALAGLLGTALVVAGASSRPSADEARPAAAPEADRIWLDRNYSVGADDLDGAERRLRAFLDSPAARSADGDHALETESTHRLAMVLEEQGRQREAVDLLTAFSETQRVRRDGRGNMAITLIRLGRAQLACGNSDEAQKQLDRADDLLDRSRTPVPGVRSGARSELASTRALLLAKRADFAAARAQIDAARGFIAGFPGKGYWLVRRADLAETAVRQAAGGAVIAER